MSPEEFIQKKVEELGETWMKDDELLCAALKEYAELWCVEENRRRLDL
jgi:hypothetical protein